ncbi:family 43 glycosylhydrolase [Pedobacter sp. MC2016-24]|uniref:family 43 glycosylhydrolase n=1 Tax=Pedobacter sp. MC2016-24 TaxID=2780090 RepID=UPI001D16F08D|nr:family 43 glycosylhydrolase [Pedobacter sp. MC2016-24]
MASFEVFAQKPGQSDAIYSGVPWFDQHGKVVSAHGANIVKDNARYYLFGEAHTDTSNAFVGFNCYSSVDLYNWKFERVALPVQTSGKLGPNRVAERVKVMKCPSTGLYMMYMHVDTLGYKDQFVGYATSNSITGPYTFQGPLLFDGKPIRKWDMGTFQDRDGSGYVLIHGGEVYKLAEDYRSIIEQVNKNMTAGFESPTMFRKDNLYYFLGSHLTSWEKNDNYYYTATSLKGPWTLRGLFAPEGSLTWNSQTTFVLPVEGSKDSTYLFMGDRWSFPKQASAATYVWQPLTVSGTSIAIPAYQDAWRLNIKTGLTSPKAISQKIIEHTDDQRIQYTGKWKAGRSDTKGDSFAVKFEGTGISFYALSAPDHGYGSVLLQNDKGAVLCSAIVDFYSLKPISGLKFISPELPKGKYTLTISVLRERPNWSDKRKTTYGSTGYFIALDKVVIKN